MSAGTSDNNLDYIDSIDYATLERRIKDLCAAMTELNTKSVASRRLRHQEVDIEGERKAGRLQADEMYVPQHIIDTNIRREQSAYIQYITQSPRACILSSPNTPSTDSELLEKDLTKKLRYNGWQNGLYANVDGFQQNGYGVMEVVYDESKPGHVAHEFVQLGDFAYVADTRDIQESEMVGRSYYFSRTKLKSLAESGRFNPVEVTKIIEGKPLSGLSDAVIDSRDKSLYKIDKIMFRVKGVVMVAWTCESRCDNWVSNPKTLFIGRRLPYKPEEVQQMVTALGPFQSPMEIQQAQASVLKKTSVGKEAYESNYPYIVFPYLISENDTISQLKGRAYLDQDTQEAVTSLISSFCTAHRRASQFYASKDTEDPNADLMLQKDIFFKPGALINAKIKQFQLTAPDSEVMQAVMTLVTANQNETSQVNFAAQNRKDSRKTATEISAASQSQQALSTVQVVLFSNSLRQTYGLMFEIIQSRVAAGLIEIQDPRVKALYGIKWELKPAGDVDVIERQQLLQAMMQAWPVMQQTPAAVPFLCDMLTKAFPETAANYIQIIMQANSQQAQQQQSYIQQMAQGIQALASHPEMFSEQGKQQALPKLKQAAQLVQQQQQPQNAHPPTGQ